MKGVKANEYFSNFDGAYFLCTYIANEFNNQDLSKMQIYLKSFQYQKATKFNTKLMHNISAEKRLNSFTWDHYTTPTRCNIFKLTSCHFHFEFL